MPNQITIDVRSPEDLGRAIAELRRSRGLTQEEVAETLGVTRSVVAHLERGRHGRTLGRILLLLRRLGATITITAEVPDGEA